MYTLDCPYYKREFLTISALVQDVLDSGQDPDYYILYNGENSKEKVTDYLPEE